MLLSADELGALFAIRRIISDLVSEKKFLVSAAQNPVARTLKMKVGFRAGVIEVASYDTRLALVQEAKAAQLHSRLGDLPGAPSKYIVTGTLPENLSDAATRVLHEIDEIIDCQPT